MLRLRNLVEPVLGMARDWLEARREKAKARLDADIAIEHRRASADIDWDIAQARNSDNSWKDEAWTLVFMAPLIAVFIPALQEHVREGFIILEEVVPDWFLVWTGAAVMAAFGASRIIRPTVQRRSARGSSTSENPQAPAS